MKAVLVAAIIAVILDLISDFSVAFRIDAISHRTNKVIRSGQVPYSSARYHHQLQVEKNHHDIELSQYDFSSQRGWDDFYRQLENLNSPTESDIESRNMESERSRRSISSSLTTMSTAAFEFEWHNSIPHSAIMDEITWDASTNSRRVLMVGTGNSRLPRVLYDGFQGEVQVTCLDYSQPCIDMLKTMHASDCPNMKFICGDVTELENVVRKCEHGGNSISDLGDGEMQDEWKYDYIVDKGLMDALMCTDGWDGCGAVLQYFQQARKVMKPDGKIILVTYKVTASTLEFLEWVGNDIGIIWKEVSEKSNHRVSFMVGTSTGTCKKHGSS